MRYRRLDLNLLIALDALFKDKSVTRAAAKLNMTQPAMSGALSRLRENFDDPLLVRVGHQLELTPRAEALVEPVHDIILRIDSAMDVEPGFDPAKSKRRFVIVASDYVIRVFLLDVLRKIRKIAPRMTFEFRNSSLNAMAKLEAGEIDFIIGPAIDTIPDHPHAELFEDTYSVVAASENSVIGDTLTIDEFSMLGHVTFRAADGSTPWADRWLSREYGESRQIAIATYSFDMLPRMIVGTDLIALLQTRLAVRYSEIMPLKIYEPPLDVPKLTEVLQWNRYRDDDPASQWLRDLLMAEADEFVAKAN